MAEQDKIYNKFQEFSKINEQFSITSKLIEAKKGLNKFQKIECLLEYIAREILIIPQYFPSVIETFTNELPKLLLKAISFNKDFPFNQSRHTINCILLANVVKVRSDLKSYSLQYFKEHPPPFEDNSKHSPKRSRIALANNVILKELDVVKACYFLLRSDPKFYRQKWQWSTFIRKYLLHKEDEVTWLACHTIGIVLGLNEPTLHSLLSKRIPDETIVKLTIEFESNNFSTTLDTPSLDQHPTVLAKSNDLVDVVSISGIYIPALDGPKKDLLIEVPSTYSNLKKVALGLSSNKALCLQGPVGSGKTGLIEHLAAKTGRKLGDTFIKVQLGDQTDSKMLLGTYRCTDVPGEFIWQPGVLTQAVIEGNWILLEDIDLASMDIASVLASLLENNALTVPGYRDLVPITPGFQLFVTQRLFTTITGTHKKHSSAMTLLEKQLLQIVLDPLTNEELKHILHTWYPQFDTIADRLINVFQLFTSPGNPDDVTRVPRSARLISTRDFFKWCSRAVIDFDVKSQESALKVLQDAIDVFCCSSSDNEEALNLAKEISSHLGIINQKAEYFFNSYKPSMQLTSTRLIAGRVNLSRDHTVHMKMAKFCFTRPASVLLERIMCCVKLKEPVLLVGETGTGKTSSVQYLAHSLGKRLVVINMNQQSDSADLLGGFKPVDVKLLVSPLRREFEEVFAEFFEIEPNRLYLSKIAFAFNNQKFYELIKLMKNSTRAALNRLTSNLDNDERETEKKEKDEAFLKRWRNISEKLSKLEIQIKHTNALAFAFVEGSLVKAVQEGSWVLLDEINLANAETLECLSGLLEGTEGSLCLLERGDREPVRRHPDFTLFACMNPATNVGKKDLPVGLRNRFTEFYVDELTEKSDLILLVHSYLEAMSLKEKDVAKIVDFYLKIRKEMSQSLCDGLGHKPHFSLRSLCRALMIASRNPCGTFKRSLFEAFCLSFLTQLDSDSYRIVEDLIAKYLVGDGKSLKAVLQQPIPEPKERGSCFLQFEGYWIKRGHVEPAVPNDYILTSSVRKNLKDLARVVSIGKLPVLLQGDTSVGKTSLITYLSKSSGNKCVRINNHEHTDLQEYIGSYVADTNGKLVFREGVLVEAMRKGHWIILDELNLAPTDVLEALNRVLDDNRELFIPETQETVKADPNFMLFATQNPPGAYGGRKMLSRAFRNRFVELHFNEIPANELQEILHQRCAMPPSYAEKMINVMTDLQLRRRGSAAFAGKQGFITLRDLFRWGERYRLAQNPGKLYDWNQHLTDEGYLVLAGKVRKEDEKKEIVEVLQKHWKREVNLENLFSLRENTSTVTRHILQKLADNSARYPNIVWTLNMRKLAVLVAKALEFKEPVLLVGETGGGKTTICQLIAENNGQELVSVNCHMHTESSDFIGGLRPVRDHSESKKSLFEWVDGPLLQAMTNGSVFLADEISLADDSVLERLNSLLEPERTLLLAEKGIDLNNPNNSETVVAHKDFVFIGTMNPGGDFGKKELSPALRNRFTEIWCESCNDRNDLINIIDKNLIVREDLNFGVKIMDFIKWFRSTEIGKRYTISIRDILTWTHFINSCSKTLPPFDAYIHGAHLVFLDSLGSGVTSTESALSLKIFKTDCENFLNSQIDSEQQTATKYHSEDTLKLTTVDSKFGISPFFVPIGSEHNTSTSFSFEAPTTLTNTLNVLRGMQLNKAILLEGSPGVGKTSLVTALARYSRHKIFRVNLSDQTDISDLFGADLPVEGGTGGQFSWRDGPLLQALKEGSWILLDELNLASQSVLEGLNACLDHRGEIFIPELGKTFYVKPGTRFFACQNPMKQGGSRRGLPKSFLNRFIQVYVSPFSSKDMEIILSNQFPTLPQELIIQMIHFNYRLAECLDKHIFGNKGAPWECNLRDLTRWCEATLYQYENNALDKKRYSPESVAQLIYVDRMRTASDKKRVEEVFIEAMGCLVKGSQPLAYINKERVYFGDISIHRGQAGPNDHVLEQDRGQLILRGQLGVLRSLTYCVNQNWMAILVGSSGVGKSNVVKTLANLAGKTLKTLPVTSAMDTTDILGGFEQTNYSRHLEEIAKEAERQTLTSIQNLLIEEKISKAAKLLDYWEEYVAIGETKTQTMEEEVHLFLRRISKLEALLKELYLKCNSTDEGTVILQLLDRCSKISSTVSNDKSLSAGGRFEWVNSVLVKCLQEGSWLLVDNVNLCSAAVLDRLNALLEPNGVLTISEKGVDENGKMYEIKPHPDFRIILTMDPKNGEISRAMRNRGVEIYMLNETEAEHSHNFDIKSLIEIQGLSNPNHINILLKIHEFIAGLILSEKPNNSEILHCASLVSQKLLHGENVFDAFYNTTIEVYYKTRYSSEFNCNNILEVIQDGVRRCLDEITEINDDFYNTNVTLSTRDLARWSDFEKVKHQSGIFERAIKAFKNDLKPMKNQLLQEKLKASKLLPDYLKGTNSLTKSRSARDLSIWSDLENVNIHNKVFENSDFYTVANLLANLYATTSTDDIDYRTFYLQKTVPYQEWQTTIQRFNRSAKFFNQEILNIPLDSRWLGDCFSRNPESNICDNINYALQIGIQQLRDLLESKLSSKTSLFQYLMAVSSKTQPDIFYHPLVSSYLQLHTEFFIFMRQTCVYIKNNYNADVYVKFLSLLSWRQALHSFTTSVDIPDGGLKNPRSLASKLDALTLYHKWFYKHAVQEISVMFNITIPDRLNVVLEHINQEVSKQFSPMLKVAKEFKKTNNVPEVFKHESQLSAVSLLDRYDLSDTKQDTVETLSVFQKCPDLRRNLVKLQKDILSQDNVIEQLSSLRVLLENKPEIKSFKMHELELYPLVDALTQKLLLYVVSEAEMRNKFDLDSFNENTLVPVEFNGVLLKYKENVDNKLLHEIRKCFSLYSVNSASVKIDKFIKDAKESIKNFLISGVNPVFSYVTNHLLVRSETNRITLNNFKEVQEQQKYLELLLWNNMYSLSNKKFDFITLHLNILKLQIKSFLNHLQDAIKTDFSDFETLEYNPQILLDKGITDTSVQNNISEIFFGYSSIKTLTENGIQPDDVTISIIADLYMLLGYTQAYLNSLLPEVDPLAKKTMKRNHVSSVVNVFKQMKRSFELQNSLYSNAEGSQHPYYDAVKSMIVTLEEKLEKYGDIGTIGCKVHPYNYVVQQIKHGFNNVLNSNILSTALECSSMIHKLNSNRSKTGNVDIEKLQAHIERIESNLPSLESIFLEWKLYRSSYPDILEPILANVAQFCYGLKLKLYWIKREFEKYQHKNKFDLNLEQEITNLASFPSLNENIDSLEKHIDYYSGPKMRSLIDNILDDKQAPYVKAKENLRLLKCGIQEYFNQCVLKAKNTGKLEETSLENFKNLLAVFIDLWNMQQKRREEKQNEAENLYKTKTKCDDKTEAEQIQDELEELFPNYHTIDFQDLQNTTLEDSNVSQKTDHATDLSDVITEEDLKFVTDLHGLLFKNFVANEWLSMDNGKNVRPDFVGPLMAKHEVMRKLMKGHVQNFKYDVDGKLTGSLAVLLEVSRRYGVYSELGEVLTPTRIVNKKTNDFYKDSDVEEVQSCNYVLEELKNKIKELLQEWPDQSTLNTILTVIDRIQNFDITSPVARFLTGFDILLAKCHEWEQVAHAGVSLVHFSPNLVEQVIKWRKMELVRWKDLLNSTFENMTKSLGKWWLYMYNLMNQYVTERKVTEVELVDICQKFITRSSLVEFQGRLEMLLEFHCHVVTLKRTAQTESFSSILWNVFNYFQQFLPIILNKLRELRTPIEKKLKDYVKIVKWKDVSYWSIKGTVDKSYKTLHKFVREYKEVLLQPVSPYLTNPSSGDNLSSTGGGIWDRPQRQNPKAYHYTLDPDSYVVKASTKDIPYLSKARKICKDAILGTRYPVLIKSLDGFTTEIIETSQHLRNLEVDTTLPKERQKSQAKNILQRKHRALADLFQNLTKIGVSYKTGILDSKLKNSSEDFTMKPIDLSASFKHLGHNRINEKILTIWESCELYYYRCLMRADVLETALVAPARDLGMQNVERCKGFSAQLLNLCQKQKNILIRTTRSHYYLRTYSRQIREACETSEYISKNSLTKIQDTMDSISIVALQIKIILNSAPEEDTLGKDFLEVPLLEPNNTKIQFKYDQYWNSAVKYLNEINSTINKVFTLLKKSESFTPSFEYNLLNPFLVPFNNKTQLLEDLKHLIGFISDLSEMFRPIPISESLDWLEKVLSSILTEITNFEPLLVKSPSSNVDFENILEECTKATLLVFQNLYKKYRDVNDSKLQETDEQDDGAIEENHLKSLIIKSLSDDTYALELDKIVKLAETISLINSSVFVNEEFKSSTLQFLPFLDQIVQLSEYFITQQVSAYRTTCKMTSILLNIFIDLASKGFCIPPELSEELDKEGMSKPSDGLGLGEGQGERDVSDKIESEDQLDDAQPAGQDKEQNEDPDCEEEDKGIEMSEDFDSKLQDKKKGDDDEEEESDKSDAEEQMGETDKGAEQLDQEIWGDDKDENNPDEEDLEEQKEEGKGGEKDGKDQLGAKEDDSKEKSQNKEPKGDKDEDSEKNKKEINEMEEPEFDEHQTDPYHGNQPELPEPEPMDLPDDLQLDEGEENDGEKAEENPFDVDEMKEQQISEDKPDDTNTENKEENQHDEEKDFSSDEEDVRKKDGDKEIDGDSDEPDESKPPEEKESINEPKETEREQEEPEEESVETEESGLDQNPSNEENVQAMEVDEANVSDKTQTTQAENLKSDQASEELLQEDKPDNEGVGQSQMEQSESGHSVQSSAQQDAKQINKEQSQQEKKKEKPGESDSKRSLGDVNQPAQKRLKTMEAKENEKGEPERTENETADMYQHIKEAKEEATTQVLDAATKEQADEQRKDVTHDDKGEPDDNNEDVENSDNVPESNKNENMDADPDTVNEKPLKTDSKEDKSKTKKQHKDGDILEEIQEIEIEGEIVKTSTVPRGGESYHQTQYHLLKDATPLTLTQEEINNVRSEVERQLSSWKTTPTSSEAEMAWQKISAVTSNLAQDLSEQLRLVLEPTQASHLKGDFRTGRRINMRKVIPYIASQFRKDKIWLRRTKPSKREYQIVLAIDDSSSMADNHSKELAFESVALVSKALSLLESGQLAVVSFGENTDIHHKLSEPFTDRSGVELLQNFQFKQQKTYVGKLVNFVTEMFEQSRVQASIPNAKLLLIVSDGRGVFSEGKTFVTQAIRRAKLSNIFIVFVIIDSPENKNSVLDIKSTIFKGGQFLGTQSYMDEFPFSFYIILRDINSLPGVLSDALMQWFEMVTSQQ